jgi:AraC family transcriptional regulator
MPSKKTRKSSIATTTLYVKNMVCDRCIRVVRDELEALKLDIRSVVLGEVVVAGTARDLPVDRIRKVLEENGFELIEDRRAKTIEQLKLAVLKLVREENKGESRAVKQSEYLSRELGLDYHYLSKLFSSVENITLEHYVILQRIELAKELLKYGELTLSEIAYRLGYSSVQHLSNQFKSVTGFTPTAFKKQTSNVRRPIDKVSD